MERTGGEVSVGGTAGDPGWRERGCFLVRGMGSFWSHRRHTHPTHKARKGHWTQSHRACRQLQLVEAP